MAALLEKLLVVQHHDQQLSRLVREAHDIPKRKQSIEGRLEAQRKSLEQANREWQDKTAALKNLEIETETSKTKIKKFREQQFQIKSNHEYRALELEIKHEEEKISGIEDREIALMDEVEAARQRVMEIERGMAVDAERVKTDHAQLDDRAGELARKVEEMREVRKGLVADVPDEALSRYERIFKHVKDMALVPIQNGACGGCHMNLPPQVVNDAKKLDDMSFCSYCGRIVYRKD